MRIIWKGTTAGAPPAEEAATRSKIPTRRWRRTGGRRQDGDDVEHVIVDRVARSGHTPWNDVYWWDNGLRRRTWYRVCVEAVIWPPTIVIKTKSCPDRHPRQFGPAATRR
jgi:hypothetical protein